MLSANFLQVRRAWPQSVAADRKAPGTGKMDVADSEAHLDLFHGEAIQAAT
jgi:hypothetical protein